MKKTFFESWYTLHISQILNQFQVQNYQVANLIGFALTTESSGLGKFKWIYESALGR
jgi:hypothetical protein